MFKRFTKKRALSALTFVAVLAVAGIAVAYFTGSGNGTGQASVGSSSNFSVAVVGDSSKALLPGYGSETLSYTITNNGSGVQNLGGTSAAVAHDSSGNVKANGTAVPGCLASWFNVTDNHPTYGEVSGGDTRSGTVTLTMSDVNQSQDSCQGVSPDVTVSAS